MCSIIASFNKDVVKDLAKLNEYRGQYSHSLFVFNIDDHIAPIYEHRAFGPLEIDKHDLPKGYIICHQQAPTTDNKDTKNIHPAQLGNHLLYHNGIIKHEEIERLAGEFGEFLTWDTELILEQLITIKTPENIDGSFSCVWYDTKMLNVFRNEISPMFVSIDDHDIVLSSTKFDHSYSIDPNIMYEINFDELDLKKRFEFNTVCNPYFFG